MRLRVLRPAGDPVPLPPWSGRVGHTDSVPLPALADEHNWRVFLFGSGSAALAAAVIASIRAHTSPTPEVVIPAFACPDLVAAVRFAGAAPVVVDTSPDSPCIDPAALARVLSPHTTAVIHLRFLGLPGNGPALRSVLGRDGPRLIEDAAHVYPRAGILDNSADNSADAVVYSFGRGKPLSLRTGGLLLHRREFADAVPAPTVTDNSLRSQLGHWLRCAAYDIAIEPHIHGLLTRVLRMRTDVIGWRELDRLHGFPPHLSSLLARRLRDAAPDRQALQRLWGDHLSHVPGPWVDLAAAAGARTVPLWRYPMLLADEHLRDRLFHTCRREGLGASRLYRRPLAALPGCPDRLGGSTTPNAADFAARLLALPLHGAVRPGDVARFERVLVRFAREHDRFGSARARRGDAGAPSRVPTSA